jgi:predicted site-specific integrase-resolvase
MTATTSPKSVSTWEAARVSGFCDQTIRNLIRKGKLRADRGVDGRYRLDLAQIEKLAEARKALAQVLAS